MNTLPSPPQQSGLARDEDKSPEARSASVEPDALRPSQAFGIYVDDTDECCFVRSLN